MAQQVKNPPVTQETQDVQVRSLGQEDPLEEKVAIPSSILVWEIPWIEKPERLHTAHGVTKSQASLSTSPDGS